MSVCATRTEFWFHCIALPACWKVLTENVACRSGSSLLGRRFSANFLHRLFELSEPVGLVSREVLSLP